MGTSAGSVFPGASERWIERDQIVWSGECHSAVRIALELIIFEDVLWVDLKLILFRFDIMTATRSLSKPGFPLLIPTRSIMQAWIHDMDRTAVSLSRKLATGFDVLERTGLQGALLTVIHTMRDITVGLDHYQRGGTDSPELMQIAMARNFAQHDLLSLPHLSSVISSQENCIYEVCRLASLIFSDMVLWPLPAATKVRERLALNLMSALGACRLLLSWASYPSLLLWATVLGGIVAGRTARRNWFFRQLDNGVIKRTMNAWSVVKGILSTFLWWDFVCHEPAAEFWKDACVDANRPVTLSPTNERAYASPGSPQVRAHHAF